MGTCSRAPARASGDARAWWRAAADQAGVHTSMNPQLVGPPGASGRRLSIAVLGLWPGVRYGLKLRDLGLHERALVRADDGRAPVPDRLTECLVIHSTLEDRDLRGTGLRAQTTRPRNGTTPVPWIEAIEFLVDTPRGIREMSVGCSGVRAVCERYPSPSRAAVPYDGSTAVMTSALRACASPRLSQNKRATTLRGVRSCCPCASAYPLAPREYTLSSSYSAHHKNRSAFIVELRVACGSGPTSPVL
jgi:hypothetical protein